jgi:hypothetical protein
MSCVHIGTLSERDSGPAMMPRQSQDIAVRQIHPRKLSTLLKSRFGPGEYEICVGELSMQQGSAARLIS